MLAAGGRSDEIAFEKPSMSRAGNQIAVRRGRTTRAYFARVELAATGSTATPDIGWDRATGRGRPFHYFASARR